MAVEDIKSAEAKSWQLSAILVQFFGNHVEREAAFSGNSPFLVDS